MQKLLHSFLYLISFLLALALSIKSLREPDIWWQIRTGEWIIAHGQVPTTDVFSFTHYGQPWINIKWGFEVMAAFITKHLGAESVFVLQMMVSMLILYFIKKILDLYKLQSPALFFVITVILLFTIEYRMIGRPEMFSHLMVVIWIYLLLLYEKTASRLIFLLIPLQLIWCNLHEAYATGIIMLAIHTLVSWFIFFTGRAEKPLRISLITLLASAAIIANPRGFLLLTRPFNIFGQVQQNKYTTELDSFFNAGYWHKESYIFVVIAIAFLLYLFYAVKNKQFKNGTFFFPMHYVAICLAFLFLAFTAYRNIIFFQLAVIPFVAYLINRFFPKIEKFKAGFAFAGLFFYIMVVSNKYYEITRSRDRFGLEVLSISNPSGAANFIAQKNLAAQKCFSDYLTSSYLLWKLQPQFRTFIDLRDLDIFSTSFFEKYLGIINQPEKFFELDRKDHYQYVVLYRKSSEALHHYLYNDSLFACTFVDPVAAVYERTDDIPSGDIFQDCKPIPASSFASAVNTIFNPAYTPFDYDNLNLDYEAASWYTNVGKISLAEQRINRFLQTNPANEEAIQLREQILSLKSQIKK